MVVVVDYRAGNLYNVGNALKKLSVPHRFSGEPAELESAERVILPGVGSARAAMDSLSERGLVDVIRDLKVPFLGICLGLQLLYQQSQEELTTCLGLMPGQVSRFDSSLVKVPHIGWNQVDFHSPTTTGSPLFEGIPSGAYFYFVHSYYAPVSEGLTFASTEYGIRFSSVVGRDNFFAVQFHPERSGEPGLRLLSNFMRL